MNGTAIGSAASFAGPGAGFAPQIMADFNGDGRMDIVWTKSDGSSMLTTMNGLTGSSNILTGAGPWTPTHAPDLNGDGTADLLWRNTDGTVSGWLMRNGAASAFGTLLGPGTGWSVVGVGDVSGDGRDDII